MKKEFTPTINQKAFKEMVLQIQDNEGNNPLVVQTIAQKMKLTPNAPFLNTFMNVCRSYHIDYQCHETVKADHPYYEVVIYIHGRKSWEVSYDHINHDISKALAKKLYHALGTEIKNEDFLKDIQ